MPEPTPVDPEPVTTPQPDEPVNAYPHEREAEIALRDGSTLHVRPVRADDRPAIRAFLEGVSPDSIGLRFFGRPSLDWATDWSLDVDYADRFAIIAEVGQPRRVIAHVAYVRAGRSKAEVAFLVDDAWQGHGIATILLAHLAEVARPLGITTFIAEVLPRNHKMIDMFRRSGFPVQIHSTADGIEVEMPTSLSPEALERFEVRERSAAVAAVRGFLKPSSVAVIGASRRRNTIGGELLRNLIAGQFAGPVYAVNPHADVVQSLPAYHHVADIPSAVDLGVVVVPAEEVVGVAQECADAGIRALLVISAGFAEAGEVGAARQRELLAVCRDSGMRLIGPNCLGVLNTEPDVSLNATFAPRPAIHGRVGFMSQSGGLGIAIIEAAGRLGIGLSSFVSVGNKADLSGNDFLRYWEQDPSTDVALLYLESFGNPRKFARIAPHFARRKPLVVVKSGRSAAGARATSSHTGALLSASDVTVDALFAQAGVIRTDTLHELFTVGALLSAQPVPAGDRVAILTNAGGPGILCADACQAEGVDVPVLSDALRDELAAFLPDAASARNPVDMLAPATASDYAQALRILAASGECDAILTIFVPPLVTAADDVAAAIRAFAETAPPVALAAVFMTSEGPPPALSAGAVTVPGFEFPEDAARAVALAARYGRWRSRPEQEPVVFSDTEPDRAAAVISRELAAGAGWLSAAGVAELLDCYRLPLVATRIADSPEAAVAAAAELGAPVALKASARGLIHKTAAGGVRLDLADPAAVAAAAAEIDAALAAAGLERDVYVVQRMEAGGVEMIVGVVNDQSFGPVLACGAGGTTAELVGDVAVRITPVGARDAEEMLRSLRTFPLLEGFRGAQPCDVAAVQDVILRVNAMVETHPEIAELDLNPLIARPDGAVIVDARVRVEPAVPPPPRPSLLA